MAQEVTIWQISNNQIFVAIQPAISQDKLEVIQTEVLTYIKIIGQGALAGEFRQRKGISYFRITTPSPWAGLKKAVELGLFRSLVEQ